ncbi:hypothetical protein RF11_05530 [Thelohanellus kitauei]|uniref:Uncharacterized protein n=1 Tax=Thelohanellus kitauei TaxID=669202 RepID=A0A0C2MCR8_THEKT|nr:hypothetical protein RF11_05530 [Thelohanellus kitauei]
MTMESFVERGVCSLFSILFIKFTSTVKVRVGKTPSEPLEITDAILKEKLFTNFDLDEFEEMAFEIVTPGHPWMHGITSETRQTDEGAEVVSALYVEYQITFYYHILNKMLKIRFQPNLKTDQKAFNNLFSLIEKELKSVESNGLDVD